MFEGLHLKYLCDTVIMKIKNKHINLTSLSCSLVFAHKDVCVISIPNSDSFNTFYSLPK